MYTQEGGREGEREGGYAATMYKRRTYHGLLYSLDWEE